MTRGKAPAPAKKKKSKGHPVLRAVLALAVLAVVVLLVLPSPQFGRWIAEPRSFTAIAGGVGGFLLLWLVALKVGAKSDAAFYAVVAVAVAAGGVLYVGDAGSAVVRAGMLDCPKPSKGTVRVAAPDGRQCVEVPRCPSGKVPGWQADRDTPTGKCLTRKAAR